jgi:flagellar protein FliS
MMENESIHHYRETQIKTASRGKLVVLLYDGLIRFLDIALENLPHKRYDVVNANILKAQDIISELIMALNMGAGDISQKLLSIYSFLNIKLIDGNMKKDDESIKFVRRMVSELRDAWKKVAHDNPGAELKGKRKVGGIDIAG